MFNGNILAVYMATSPAQASGYMGKLHKKKHGDQVEKRPRMCSLGSVSRTRASTSLKPRIMGIKLDGATAGANKLSSFSSSSSREADTCLHTRHHG